MELKYYTANAVRKDQIMSAIAEILMQADRIDFSYIFGSFIDVDIPFHDIDLGVFFVGNNRLQMSEDANNLATILSRKTGYPVDVRVLNNAPVSFVYNVLKGKLIYEKNEDIRCQVMENTVRSYLDMKPILYLATKEAFSS
jgi:predicted nucleotidyltransferase